MSNESSILNKLDQKTTYDNCAVELKGKSIIATPANTLESFADELLFVNTAYEVPFNVDGITTLPFCTCTKVVFNPLKNAT